MNPQQTQHQANQALDGLIDLVAEYIREDGEQTAWHSVACSLRAADPERVLTVASTGLIRLARERIAAQDAFAAAEVERRKVYPVAGGSFC